MSKFLSSERCPRCASKGGDKKGNNLAVYDDGHKWCYACGFFQPATALDRYLSERKPLVVRSDWFTPSSVFAEQGIKFLKQYGLTNQEINSNFFWDNKNYLVFNGKDYQCARNLSGTGPKYLTKGIVRGNEVVMGMDETLLSSPVNSVVIVEDAISAIKLSRVVPVVALHCAVIPLQLLQRLSKTFKHLIVWLDMDKAKESLSEASKALPYFDSVNTIWTPKDPKKYSTEELKGYIT